MDTAQTCADTVHVYPALLFLLGATFTALRLKRRNRLGLGATMQVLFGAKRVPRDRVSSILTIATLFLPLGLWLYLGRLCTLSVAIPS
ncbi:MAG: hypothetical protein N4A53_04715 [Pelagimonas sp.]|jgi:hypothetical protein|nr:hypothetical protein [Pelagimonas sp.]